MYAIKVGWAGQAVALATSNDPGGRKSRIRHSKEERKAMVESFIKKYQKLNNGNFPSLNLTQKEVGGSFYKVREIVREIIQDNRVLAPPKVCQEPDHSEFLEQHPLGSISMEPQTDLSVSDKSHNLTYIVPNKYQITSEENISGSSVQFQGPNPLELDNEQVINGLSEGAEKDEGSDRASISYPNQDTSMEEVSNASEQLPQHESHKFANEKIVNGAENLGENAHSDKPHVTIVVPIYCQDNNDSALLSSQEFNGTGGQRISDEQYLNKNDQTVDKTKEFGQRIYMESPVMEILDREKYEAQDVEPPQAVKSHMNSNVVVEAFPLRPVPSAIHTDGESLQLNEAAGILEDEAIHHDRRTYVQSSSDFVNEKDEEKLPDSTMELNGKNRDEKVVLNLQSPYLESSKESSATNPRVLDIGDIADLESKDSLADGTKASSSSAAGRKFSDQDNSSLPKGNNPMLDRINLETWEEASKKSTRPESNPLLALIKAFVSSFLKFWTE